MVPLRITPFFWPILALLEFWTALGRVFLKLLNILGYNQITPGVNLLRIKCWGRDRVQTTGVQSLAS